MTREEAIKVLSSYDVNGVWADVDGKPYNAEEQAEAFDMAIEALKDRPKGEWIDEDGTYYANCSECGYQIDTHEERGYHIFCPNCGADMRGGEDK